MARGRSHDDKQEELVRSQSREDMVWTVLFTLFICILLNIPAWWFFSGFFFYSFGTILGFEISILVVSIAAGCWYWKREVHTSRRFFTRKGRITCPHCGYQLRGITVERCPECGNAFTSRPASRSRGGQETPLDKIVPNAAHDSVRPIQREGNNHVGIPMKTISTVLAVSAIFCGISAVLVEGKHSLLILTIMPSLSVIVLSLCMLICAEFFQEYIDIFIGSVGYSIVALGLVVAVHYDWENTLKSSSTAGIIVLVGPFMYMFYGAITGGVLVGISYMIRKFLRFQKYRRI